MGVLEKGSYMSGIITLPDINYHFWMENEEETIPPSSPSFQTSAAAPQPPPPSTFPPSIATGQAFPPSFFHFYGNPYFPPPPHASFYPPTGMPPSAGYYPPPSNTMIPMHALAPQPTPANFRLGDIVWAKPGKQSCWPGQVLNNFLFFLLMFR